MSGQMSNVSVHSVETSKQCYIKRFKYKVTKFCVHIGKYLVYIQDTNGRYRKISQLVKLGKLLPFNSWKLMVLTFMFGMFGCPFLPALGAAAQENGQFLGVRKSIWSIS